MIRTQAGTFELVEEHRGGWNLEVFKERYSDILDKYDYIVGDWGYGQLRLRGFYDNGHRKVPFEQKIASLDEYLHEFCNFGCAYFVLRRISSPAGEERRPDAGGRDKQSQPPETEMAGQEQPFHRSSGQHRPNGRGERSRPIRSRQERDGQDRTDRGEKSQRGYRADSRGGQTERKERQESGRQRSSSSRPNGRPQREHVSAGGYARQDSNRV
ncbi:MAG: DUF1027 domain-containing protein [Brevibacillus sp.]|nr:DUF1027 domain-containing protein [Brevibacillus sp.]